jgi:hypothetical protein
LALGGGGVQWWCLVLGGRHRLIILRLCGGIGALHLVWPRGRCRSGGNDWIAIRAHGFLTSIMRAWWKRQLSWSEPTEVGWERWWIWRWWCGVWRGHLRNGRKVRACAWWRCHKGWCLASIELCRTFGLRQPVDAGLHPLHQRHHVPHLVREQVD